MSDVRIACGVVGFWWHVYCIDYKPSNESLRLSKLILRHTGGVQINMRSSSRVFKSNKYARALSVLDPPSNISDIICTISNRNIWYKRRLYYQWVARTYNDGVIFSRRHVYDNSMLFHLQRNPHRDIQHDALMMSALATYFHAWGCSVIIRYKK